MPNTLIGISGGTGSGKTTLANSIIERFSGEPVVLMHQDSYYRDLSHLKPKERLAVNFDHPDAIENELLARHIKELKAGRAVKMPVYDFRTHTRNKTAAFVAPAGIILLEGIHALADATLRDLMDIKIFVDTDADIRFIRRLGRDMKGRARTLESVVEQYLTTVRPMHYEFVEQSKRYADVIIPEGGHNIIAVDMIASRIESILLKRMVSK